MVSFTLPGHPPGHDDKRRQYHKVSDALNPGNMLVIAKTMHEDAVTALEIRNKALSEDVVNRDMDVDRLNWLIARQTNMIMQNASMSRKMGISTSMAMHYYMLSRIIERIGDHAVRIAENTPPDYRRGTRQKDPYSGKKGRFPVDGEL